MKNRKAEPAENNEAATDCDVESLMKQIRRRVREDLSANPSRLPHYVPPAAKRFSDHVSPVLYCDELNYLNAAWNNWTQSEEYHSHRPIVGRFIVTAKRAIFNFLVGSVLRRYFEREREYQMNLVRLLNAMARYIDARDAEIFWQLTEKIDHDVKAMNDRTDQLFDAAASEIVRLENRTKE